MALIAYMKSRTQLRKAGVNTSTRPSRSLNTTGEEPAALTRIIERVDAAVKHNDETAETLAAILAGRDDGAALVALVVSLGGLVDAVADLRDTQQRAAQAAAARSAAEHLRQAAPAQPSGVSGPSRVAHQPVAAPPRRPESPPRPERGR